MSHGVMSQLKILCWATCIAVIGHTQPTGRRLKKSEGQNSFTTEFNTLEWIKHQMNN